VAPARFSCYTIKVSHRSKSHECFHQVGITGPQAKITCWLNCNSGMLSLFYHYPLNSNVCHREQYLSCVILPAHHSPTCCSHHTTTSSTSSMMTQPPHCWIMPPEASNNQCSTNHRPKMTSTSFWAQISFHLCFTSNQHFFIDLGSDYLTMMRQA
jgi:hypothetical protein